MELVVDGFDTKAGGSADAFVMQEWILTRQHLSGVVLEKNQGVDTNPESVNKDPYGEGWMIKMKVDDPADVAALMDAAAYKSLVGA